MDDKKDDPSAQAPLNIEMVLESPPAAESPTSILGSGGLNLSDDSHIFGDDAAVITAAKFALVESFLRQLTRDQAFSDFVRELLLSIMKVVKSEAGSLLEVDHKKNSLFFRAVVGASSDRVSNFVIPMGQGVVGHVAESRRALVVSDVAENKLHLKTIQDAVGFEARNLVAVPIVIRGRIFGVLELLNRIGERDYTSGDVELLSYACEMAAKAIEARLMIAWAAKRAAKNAGEAA
jgi:GAF domain-containing protein